MALKAFINGSLKNLTPVGKPPVTFVNGTKKKLVKGVMFVNGVKKVLWDTNNLQIDYIDVSGVTGASGFYLSGNSQVFFANADKVIYSSGYAINRLNVTNPGSPVLDAQVSMGAVLGFSSVDSNSATAVYYARNQVSTTLTLNQLNIDLSTGSVNASNSSSVNGNPNVGCLGRINSGWINANNVGNSDRYVYVRNQMTALYNYQALKTGGSISGSPLGCPNFTKIDNTTLVGRLQVYGGTTGIGEFTASGKTAKSGDLNYQDFLYDDGVVACAGEQGFGLYNRVTSGAYTSIGTATASSNHYMRLVGKCRGYYYVVEYPTVSGGKFYLKVFNSSCALVDTVELTNLSYSSSYSRTAFLPHLSQTGYLCFKGGDNLIVRIQCY